MHYFMFPYGMISCDQAIRTQVAVEVHHILPESQQLEAVSKLKVD